MVLELFVVLVRCFYAEGALTLAWAHRFSIRALFGEGIEHFSEIRLCKK